MTTHRHIDAAGLQELILTGDAVQAVELAELAVVAAGRLMPNQPFEKEWLVELQALAWAHLGNARRVLGELRSAEEAFSYADDLWEKGEVEVGDPLGYGAVKAAGAELVGRVAAFLNRARHDPGLRFDGERA